MSNRNKKSKTAALRSATGHNKNSQHITRITAQPSNHSDAQTPDKPDKALKRELDGAEVKNIVENTGKLETRPVADPELNSPKKLTRAEKKAAKAALKASLKEGEERPLKTYFVLARPFVALGRYLRDSWREIRQVRWPNRKATWKMTFAVLVYVALFMVFLTLLDVFFTFIFDLLFKK